MLCDFVQNPAWVTQTIAATYETMEDAVAAGRMKPGWMPRLNDLSRIEARAVAASIEEYGCGVYGCVLPTLDPNIVLKLTKDTTEAEFAGSLASTLVAPICVAYHLVVKTKVKHKGEAIWFLWRDSAEHVGEVREALGTEAARYINLQHLAGQKAFSAARNRSPRLAALLKVWLDRCADMRDQTQVPEIQDLGAGLIKVWEQQHILFGDIHAGNLGLVGERWVITDPGHVAVIDPSAIDGDETSAEPAPDSVLLSGRRYGRPSEKLMEVDGMVFDAEDVKGMLDAVLPPGFGYGPHFSPHLDFWVIRGVPDMPIENALYVVTPQELAESTIYGNKVDEQAMSAIAQKWAKGKTVPPVIVDFVARDHDRVMAVVDGNEVLQLAAGDDAKVAVTVFHFHSQGAPHAEMMEIGTRLREALLPSARARTRSSGIHR